MQIIRKPRMHIRGFLFGKYGFIKRTCLMDLILMMIVVIEMTCVNLYGSFICSNKKYSNTVTWITLLVFTACLFLIVFFVMERIPNNGNGNGLLMLIGFLYLIPLSILYNQSIKYTLAIMCSGWIYTVFAFSLSIRLGYLLNEKWFEISVVLFQTLFYIITLPRFLFFLKNKFANLIQNVGDQTLTTLLQFGALWFMTAVLINYIFVVGGSAALKMTVTILLMLSGGVSFKLFYTLVIVSQKATELIEQKKIDHLTKSKNRHGLGEHAQQMIDNKAVFSIIFIDLDNFKSINDEYGHSAGDAYLIEFVKTIQKLFEDYGCLYRMSGDEFVFLYEGRWVNDLCKMIEFETSFKCQNNIEFQGLSLGHASYPQDGNELTTLMKIADFNMYQMKKHKHKNFYKG